MYNTFTDYATIKLYLILDLFIAFDWTRLAQDINKFVAIAVTFVLYFILIVNNDTVDALLVIDYYYYYYDYYCAYLVFLLVNFSRIVPNGLLVFFPSYPVMNKCLEHWQVSHVFLFSN